MPTFLHDLIEDVPARGREIDILLATAALEESKANTELHDALCRASIVLIVSHLEGFVRDCARALIQDINQFSSFSACKSDVKWTFCRSFLDDAAGSHERVKGLITLLEGLDAKLTPEPFLLGGKNDDSRNPTPAVIERVASQFGIKKPFSRLAASRAEEVFSNSLSATVTLAEEIKAHLVSATTAYTYKVDASLFGLDTASPGGAPGARSLWETFLDDLLKRRHDIAHGTNRLNGSSVADIREFQAKVNVLQYSFGIILCSHLQ
jgi:hypothetical protein